jgi:hypothetical protein
MNLKFLRWLSAGILGVGLLVGCSGSMGMSYEGSTPISEAPTTEAVTTSDEMPTTTVFVDTRQLVRYRQLIPVRWTQWDDPLKVLQSLNASAIG